ELDLIVQSDATIVHSIAEKQLLDEELGEQGRQKVFLFSWAIEIPGTEVPFHPREGMVFVGGYQHQPNVDAVIYFAREVFPLVRQRMRDARFFIVGSRVPQEVMALADEGIEVVGFVEDLGAFLDRCRLTVVPLRYGAGIKGKIGSCFSYGLPCVSTTIGVEGMGLADEEGVLVADTPEAFADAVVRLHNDESLWNRLSRAGLEFTKRNYSFDAGRKVFKSILTAAGLETERFSERSLPKTAAADGRAIVPDQPDDSSHLLVFDAADRAGCENFLRSARAEVCLAKESRIAAEHAPLEQYGLPGYCEVCQTAVDFLVDRQCGALERNGVWVPNWRERQICPVCNLNSRQRAVAVAIRKFVTRERDCRPDVYLMEQVTPVYQWLNEKLPRACCTGSEYLGEDIAPGKVVKKVRHEDVERLSFGDSSFDLVVSNDVLEHVVNPDRALREVFRVLRPGGELLMTVPFHVGMDQNRRRAQMTDGGVKHLLDPIYHGNPVSDEGSLVFVDFGWEFLEDIRRTGFDGVHLHLYWSDVYGYLGIGQHYIRAVKPPKAKLCS
ncbi:MAG: glycosyltransferase, partial [Chloroflexota bacterium]